MNTLSFRHVSLGMVALTLLALASVFNANAQDQTHETLGPGGCGGTQDQCHATTFTGWYENDPHKKSIDKLYLEERKSLAYARPFGLNMKTLFNGTSMCMKCHGTVLTKNKAGTADDAVSCESCHGPGGSYLEVHSKGNIIDGRERAEYTSALSKGLAKLEDIDVLSKTCVDCHLITNDTLRRAGHKQGDDFSYKSGLVTIAKKEHWKRYFKTLNKRLEPFDAATFALVEANKVTAIAPPPATTGNPQATKVVREVDTVIISGSANLKPVTLPPFPNLSDSLSFAEIMLLVAKRIETIGKSIGDRK